MQPFREKLHIDGVTNSEIYERWYRLSDGAEYREVIRPAGLPVTPLWTRLTANLGSEALDPPRSKPKLLAGEAFVLGVPDKPPPWR